MSLSLVAVTRPIPEPACTLLRKHYKLRVNEINKSLDRTKLKKLVQGASAILSVIPDRIDGEIMDAAGNRLRIIANYAVGFDNIDLAAAKLRDVVVTNTPGVLTEAVAEHTLGLILACARHLVEADRFVRAGKYQYWDPLSFSGPQLWGKTLGVIGLGRIGGWLIEMAHGGLGMNIVYHDVTRNEELEMRTGAQHHELASLLKMSDVVSIHLPLVPSTKHLIGAHELRLMKPTAILVNTARGSIIDEDALVRALRRKQIFAAGLDVFEQEPILARGLADLPNVVLTPHVASATHEARQAMSKIAADNILAVLSGKPAINQVPLA